MKNEEYSLGSGDIITWFMMIFLAVFLTLTILYSVSSVEIKVTTTERSRLAGIDCLHLGYPSYQIVETENTWKTYCKTMDVACELERCEPNN